MMVHLDDLNLEPFSFGGENEPEQQFALASEFDSGRIQHGVWESGPGELNLVFRWSETVYILEGRAEVENIRTGERFTLARDSLMSFERGSHWRWRIPWKLKKLFTIVE